MYDKNNIFAKILRNEIPCEKVYEDNNSLFFKDIKPQAKIHVLGIPKIECTDIKDFINKSDEKIFFSFFKSVNFVIDKLDLQDKGFRIVTNTGEDGGQEVPHFHVHILGGERI